jgi:hypothetical protein
MAKRSATVRVPVDPARARTACRLALSPEVWDLEEDRTDGLVAYEWPWRLSCQIRPARLEIRIESAADAETRLALETSVYGFGPAASRHLDNHVRALQERIRGAARRPE